MAGEETTMCSLYISITKYTVYLFGMRKFLLYEILRQDEV